MTALAPVILVWGAAQWHKSVWNAGLAFALTVLLVLACASLLAVAGARLQIEPVATKNVKRVDKEALAFLVTYALPLIAASDSPLKQLLPLGAFIFVVALVVMQLQLLHVNPLLAVFGYHFYEFEDGEGETAMLVTKSRGITSADSIVARRLGPSLWLGSTP
jgi:hypothetical protein